MSEAPQPTPSGKPNSARYLPREAVRLRSALHRLFDAAKVADPTRYGFQNSATLANSVAGIELAAALNEAEDLLNG